MITKASRWELSPVNHSSSSSLYPPIQSASLYPLGHFRSQGSLTPLFRSMSRHRRLHLHRLKPVPERVEERQNNSGRRQRTPAKEIFCLPSSLKMKKTGTSSLLSSTTKTTVAETITKEEVENLGDSGRDSDGVGEGHRCHRQYLSCQQKLLLRPSSTFRKLPYSSQGEEESNTKSMQ